jgi:hypothetical protein
MSAVFEEVLYRSGEWMHNSTPGLFFIDVSQAEKLQTATSYLATIKLKTADRLAITLFPNREDGKGKPAGLKLPLSTFQHSMIYASIWGCRHACGCTTGQMWGAPPAAGARFTRMTFLFELGLT